MLKHILFYIAASVGSAALAQTQGPMFIPAPVQVASDTGVFRATSATSIVYAQLSLKDEALALQAELKNVLGTQPLVSYDQTGKTKGIRLAIVNIDSVPEGGYSMVIRKDHIELTAPDDAGIFNGVQTLAQLLPVPALNASARPAGIDIPCMSITDFPRFAWRGMHLDVCRHFFPVDPVKKYIDLLARYKMNTFHWHLTEDQGWRIEIKKYPKLTEVGAWRSGSEYGPYSDRTFDSTRYGGFYTQEEIREMVAYAQSKHVAIVPEIEMPGHSLAALAAYPEFSCTGGPFEVEKGWGVFEDVFCPKEETFTFLENVLTEVMDLFPGEYIHIGGDECPKERWKTCAHCQALMKSEGLKDEHELQSYFIRRIETFVNKKGRKIIGWDEILEGGLAPNAAVMSWRGTEGGIAAAKARHNVVMSPGSHCYFDHYQGDPANEPLAIGGFTTVQKVYSYEPVPAELNADEAKYILGAQGNVWTEYITTPEQVEYMAVPRMLALAEVLWSPKEKRDEADFVRRLEHEFTALSALDVHYSKSLFNVGFKLTGSKKRGQVNVEPFATPGLGEIRYTLDNQEPTKDSPQFVTTLEQRENVIIRAALFRGDRKPGYSTSKKLSFDLATGRAVTVSPAPNERYNDGGPFTLIDGVSAGNKRVNNEWLGWKDDRVTIKLDLGEEQWVSRISIGALAEKYSWIQPPAEVEIAVSSDGVTYLVLDTPMPPSDAKNHVEFAVSVPMMTRYIRFIVKSIGHIPEGDAGAGNPPWMFLDEIHVR